MDAGRPLEKSNIQSQLSQPPPQYEKQQSTPVTRPAMATIQDHDERLLARIGYKQVY